MLVLLKFVGAVIILIGLFHGVFGVGADRMLDKTVPTAAVDQPSLDSQNRFYGIVFTVFGVLLWLCSTDMSKYAAVFRTLMIVFFAGGLVRIVSAVVKGPPSPLVRGLWALELAVPPLLLWWQATL